MAIVYGTNNSETINKSDGVTDNADTIYGYGGTDSIFGFGGNDLIIGGAGGDAIDGGNGIDAAFYTDSGESVFVDLVSGVGAGDTAEDDTLTNIENLFGSAYDDSLSGNNAANALSGLQGNDFLKGGGGSDTLSGGSGDDELRGGAGGDSLYGGDGLDTLSYVNSSAAVTVSLISQFAAGGHAEGDTFSGIEHIVGSSHDDHLQGDDGWNELYGNDGHDTLKGFGGTDDLFAGDGDDMLFGMDGADYLQGNLGNDILNGGSGADSMQGNEGNDTYYVDYFLDLVNESVGDGALDRVLTTVTYALDAGYEIETLEAADPQATYYLELGGNEFGNTIIGNDGENVLGGRGGIDTTIGRDGSDVHYVDNAGDIVVELGGEGADTVRTSVSYALPVGADVEVLEIDDDQLSTPITLTGNSGGSQIIGNNGANIIDGGGGVDQMIGLGGSDTYYVDDLNDSVGENGGQGLDEVRTGVSWTLTAGADVEMLRTTDDAGVGAIDLTGNASGNVVRGNSGNNVINGGDGDDELTGLGGQDSFLFDTALDAALNVDTITDFNAADDTILLDQDIFSSSLGLGPISAGEFVIGSAAQDANDRIIYNSATGALSYDSDGNGGTSAVQFATLSTGLALTNLDFLVV